MPSKPLDIESNGGSKWPQPTEYEAGSAQVSTNL